MSPDRIQPKDRKFRIRRTIAALAGASIIFPLGACHPTSSDTSQDNTAYSAANFVSESPRLEVGEYTISNITANNLVPIPHSHSLKIHNQKYAEEKLLGYTGYAVILVPEQKVPGLEKDFAREKQLIERVHSHALRMISRHQG